MLCNTTIFRWWILFISYPVAKETGNPITLKVGDSAGNGCTITLSLIKIEGSSATFIRKTRDPGPYGCPICLSGNTFIDTPNGPMNIKDLKKGMVVWTMDYSGLRKTTIILETSKTSVPKNHHMIHIVLNDDRELFGSPSHPLYDNRRLYEINIGDVIDNSIVTIAEKVQYQDQFTYDILPSGDTGTYWANGIPVKSTLIK